MPNKSKMVLYKLRFVPFSLFTEIWQPSELYLRYFILIHAMFFTERES